MSGGLSPSAGAPFFFVSAWRAAPSQSRARPVVAVRARGTPVVGSGCCNCYSYPDNMQADPLLFVEWENAEIVCLSLK